MRLEDWPGKAEGEGWRVGAEAAALQTRRRLLLAGGDPGRHAQTGQDSGLQVTTVWMFVCVCLHLCD